MKKWSQSMWIGVVVFMGMMMLGSGSQAGYMERADLGFRAKTWEPPFDLFRGHTGVYFGWDYFGDPDDLYNHWVIESTDDQGVHDTRMSVFVAFTQFYGMGTKTPTIYERENIEYFVFSKVGFPWGLGIFDDYKGPSKYRCDGLAEAAYESIVTSNLDIIPGDTAISLWPLLQMSHLSPPTGALPSVQVLAYDFSAGTARVFASDGVQGSALRGFQVWDGEPGIGILLQSIAEYHVIDHEYTVSIPTPPVNGAVYFRAIDGAGNHQSVSIPPSEGGGGGHGGSGGDPGCLRFDALIATPIGHQEIAATKAGDQVMGWDGKQHVPTTVEKVLVHDGTWTLYQYGDTWYTGNHKVLCEGKFVEVRTLSQVTQSYEGKVYHLLTATQNYCVTEPQAETSTCILEDGGLPSPVIRRFTVTTK